MSVSFQDFTINFKLPGVRSSCSVELTFCVLELYAVHGISSQEWQPFPSSRFLIRIEPRFPWLVVDSYQVSHRELSEFWSGSHPSPRLSIQELNRDLLALQAFYLLSYEGSVSKFNQFLFLWLRNLPMGAFTLAESLINRCIYYQAPVK